MSSKPIIVWTCDVVGWAYHVRFENMRRAMPEYDHRLLMGEHVPPSLWSSLTSRAIAVVCQGVKWPTRLAQFGVDRRTMIVRLDSMRIDIDGKYIDVFQETDSSVAGGQS